MRFQSCLSTEAAGSSLAQTPNLPRLSLAMIIKRAMDLLGGLLLLILCSPWMLLTALRIRRRLGGPVFQSVQLLGLHCRPFQARLFRSGKGVSLSWGTKRLPLLIQLLKGRMSLVGPPSVPVSEEASPLHWKEFRQFTMKPGLTGPWRVQKRQKPPSQEAGKANPQPFLNWSLKKDLAILLRTAALILRAGRSLGEVEEEEDYARTG